MKIKNFVDKTTNFLFKRLSELFSTIHLFRQYYYYYSKLSLKSNFIFPENTEIKNLLEQKGVMFRYSISINRFYIIIVLLHSFLYHCQ